MRTLIMCLFHCACFALLLTSCQPENERKKYTRTYVDVTSEDVVLYVVCDAETGPVCDVVYQYLCNEYNRRLLDKFYTYADQGNIAGFIQNEPWQQLFTGISQQDVDLALSGQYKFIVSKATNTVLIVRSDNSDYTAANVIYTFRAAPCL